MDKNFNIRDFLDTENMTNKEIDRCEFWVNANRIVRQSGVPNYQKERIQVNFDWDLVTMENWLDNYKDKNIIQFLKYGWPLNTCDTAINTTIPPNQQGVIQFPEEVCEYISSELKAGTIIGPFKRNPFGKMARFSPLDTPPKQDSPE